MALTRTIFQAKVTKTAAYASTDHLDISGITAGVDVVIHLRVKALVGKAVFVIEDTVNAFTAAIPRLIASPQGPISGIQELHYSWHYPRECPGLRCGTGSAEARVNLVELTGSNATVDFEAWVEIAA